MNVMAEKLEDAGVDTIGARLTAACTEAIRRHPDSVVDAWQFVGASFGHEFVRGLMDDMQKNSPQKERKSLPPHISREKHQEIVQPTLYRPRVIPPERLEKRRQLQQIVRSKYMNSAGQAWSAVGWHELSLMTRDGKEAAALLQAGPANVPNDGRTVGDVLGVQRVDQIIEEARAT